MKKIKSVKLKNDYRTAYYFLPQGTPLKFDNDRGYWVSDLGHIYSGTEIRDCKTDLFEIEYEEERKYTDFRIEYDNLEGSFGTLKIEVENIGSALRNMFRPDFDFKITKLAEGTK